MSLLSNTKIQFPVSILLFVICSKLKVKLLICSIWLRIDCFSLACAPVKKLIKKINGVSNVVVNQKQGYSLNFLVKSNDVISNLSGHLSKANFEVFALSHSRPSLDDVYLQATGKTLMDAELELAGKRDFKLENKKSMR